MCGIDGGVSLLRKEPGKGLCIFRSFSNGGMVAMILLFQAMMKKIDE